MNVHLIKTPEYSYDELMKVVEFLNSFEGPIQFKESKHEFDVSIHTFLQKYYADFKFKYESDFKKVKFDAEREYPLSWRELFSLCSEFRQISSVPADDIVILLTMRRNALNWFSHCQENDIFIHTGDWDYYTDSNAKYPIAYQVLENVLQSSMNLDIINIPNKYIHTTPRGCMNDFCQSKDQVLLKLRTADICPDCMDKIREEKVNSQLVTQVLNTFEGIRKELLYKHRFTTQVEPVAITVNVKKQILLHDLNNLEIRLNPLFKTVYIFYLKHPEGVKLKDLFKYKKELIIIYGKLASLDDNKLIEEKITELINPLSNSFSQKKSKINKILTDLLGEALAQFYRIEGQSGSPFKINLPSELIQVK